MSNIRILASSEWDAMQQTKPIAKNSNEQQTIKQQLFTRVNEVYADRWNLLKQETRKAIETLLFLAADKGYTFIGRETLADKLEIGTATVSRIIATLRDSGVIQVVYRRAKGGNGMGNPVLLFTNHPYFERWESLLGLEKESDDEADDKPKNAVNVDRASVEDVKNVPTLDLSKNILKDSKTYISKADIKGVIHSEKEIRFQNYENNPKVHAAIAGVPEELTELLLGGLTTSQIIEIWIGIRKTLSKHRATYEEYKTEVLAAASATIFKYREKKHTLKGVFNFVGCLCGFMKERIATTLSMKIDEFQSHPKRHLPFVQFLMEPSDAEKNTARLLGLFETADDLPF